MTRTILLPGATIGAFSLTRGDRVSGSNSRSLGPNRGPNPAHLKGWAGGLKGRRLGKWRVYGGARFLLLVSSMAIIGSTDGINFNSTKPGDTENTVSTPSGVLTHVTAVPGGGDGMLSGLIAGSLGGLVNNTDFYGPIAQIGSGEVPPVNVYVQELMDPAPKTSLNPNASAKLDSIHRALLLYKADKTGSKGGGRLVEAIQETISLEALFSESLARMLMKQEPFNGGWLKDPRNGTKVHINQVRREIATFVEGVRADLAEGRKPDLLDKPR